MSIIAATAKIAALAITLTCVGAGRFTPDEAPRAVTRDAGPSRLQCRMYFGCTPTSSLNTTVAQQQEYVR
jgi:hypothetical protein